MLAQCQDVHSVLYVDAAAAADDDDDGNDDSGNDVKL
jgi:hypothetical protein